MKNNRRKAITAITIELINIVINLEIPSVFTDSSCFYLIIKFRN